MKIMVIFLVIFASQLCLGDVYTLTSDSLPYSVHNDYDTLRISGTKIYSSTDGVNLNGKDYVFLDFDADTLVFGIGGADELKGIFVGWSSNFTTIKGGTIIWDPPQMSTDTAREGICLYLAGSHDVLVDSVNMIVSDHTIDGKNIMTNTGGYNIEVRGGIYRSESRLFSSRCYNTGGNIVYSGENTTLPNDTCYHIKIHGITITDGPHSGICIMGGPVAYPTSKVLIYDNHITIDARSDWFTEYTTTCRTTADAYGITLYGIRAGSYIRNNTIRSGTQDEGCLGILAQMCQGEEGNPVYIDNNDVWTWQGPNLEWDAGKANSLYWRTVPGEFKSWHKYCYITDNIFKCTVDSDPGTSHMGSRAEVVSHYWTDTCNHNRFERNTVELTAKYNILDGLDKNNTCIGWSVGYGTYSTQYRMFDLITDNVWQNNHYKSFRTPVNFSGQRGYPANNITIYRDTIECTDLSADDSTTFYFSNWTSYRYHGTNNRVRDCVFLGSANESDVVFYETYVDENVDSLNYRGFDLRLEKTLNIWVKGYNDLPVSGANVYAINNYGDTVLTGVTNSGGGVSNVVTYKYFAKDPFIADGYVLNDSLAYNNFTLKVQKGSDTKTSSFAISTYSASDTLMLSNTFGDGTWGSGSEQDCNTAPSTPSSSTPINGGEVGIRPTLCVNNSYPGTCPNALTYDFQIATNLIMSNIVTQGLGIAEGSFTTCYISTLDLAEGQTYYWRARAYNGTTYSGWSSIKSFIVASAANNAPTAPSAYSPANGSDVGTIRPILSVSNSYDADGDYKTYQFQVSSTSTFSTIYTQALGVIEGSSSTSWNVNTDLGNHLTYYWRARSYDGQEYSPWSSVWSFHTNMQGNTPPSTPVISYPVNEGEVNTLVPILSFYNSTDQDGDDLSYQIQVAPNNHFVEITAEQSFIPENAGETTNWQVNNTLEDNEDYYWRVRALDGITASKFTVPTIFYTNATTANSQPSKPVLAGPEYGTAVTNTTPALVVNNSTDIDGDALVYYFEVWNENLTSLIASSPPITEGFGTTTSWTTSPGLERAATYYWRCRSYDGTAYSHWMNLSYFYLTSGTSNFRPEQPIAYLPFNNATLLGSSHILIIFNTSDPDYDPLTYEFKICTDATMIDVVEMVTNLPQAGYLTTSYATTANFDDGAKYYWSSRAYDGYDWSAWSEIRNFTHYDMAVGAEDIPIALYPLENTNVASMRPQFQLQSIETDIDVNFYFEVADNAEFYSPIVSGPVKGEMPVTMWEPEISLNQNSDYYWRARAENSGWFQPIEFRVTADVHIAPNPYRPFEHVNGVVFKNLPQGGEIKIMTINGDLVKEFNNIDGPELNWDVTNNQGSSLASGVYLYYVKSDTGISSGKLAVIR